MSTTVDSRVVEMQFDNKSFETNAQQSMSTLEKLKNSLNFGKSAEGLKNISNSVNSSAFDGIAAGVDKITNRFSFVGRMADTVMSNIANTVVNTGQRIAREFTLDPITDGFKEYELKMGSVQTIMASSHASLETVNDVLAKLNTYADRTIYSFSDMTASIGKFTNAGVDLDTAVKAIQGISNEAALSGANANEASRAMYNFAQALSSGAVKLIDWKSIENANMATVEFKQTLLDSAVALGTVKKEGDKYVALTKGAGNSTAEAFTSTTKFNDSLQAAWMTTDVLIDALSKYSDETTDIGQRAFAAAQDVKTFSQLMDTLKEAAGSGWAESMEYIVGDFEQAKELWTGVNNIISGILDKQADSRNTLLRESLQNEQATLSSWKKASKDAGISMTDLDKVLKGHDTSVAQLATEYGSFIKAIDAGAVKLDWVKEAIRNVTNGTFEFSDSFKNLQIGDTSDDVKTLQEALDKLGYSIGDTGIDGILGEYTQAGLKAFQEAKNLEVTGLIDDATLEALKEATSTITRSGEGAKIAGKSIDEYTKSLEGTPSGRELGIEAIYNGYKALALVFEDVKSAFDRAFPKVTPKGVYNLIKAVNEFSVKLKPTPEISGRIRASFKGLFDVIDFGREGFMTFAGPALSTFSKAAVVVADDISVVSKGIGKWTSGMVRAARENDFWNKALTKTQDYLRPFGDLISKSYGALKLYAKNINIDDVISKFADAHAKASKYLAPYSAMLSKAKDKMYDYVNSLDSEAILSKFVELQGKLSTALEPLTSRLEKARKALVDFFNPNQEIFDEELGTYRIVSMREKLQPAIDFLTNAKSKIVGFFDSIKSAIDNFKSGGGDGTNIVVRFLQALAEKATATNILQLALSLATLARTIAFISKAKAFVEMGGNISKFFKDAGKTIKSFRKDSPPNAIMTIAQAIGILSGSILALSLLKPEQIAQGLKAFGIAIGALAGSMIGLSVMIKLLGGEEIGNAGKGILMFAAGLVVLSGAMFTLKEACGDIGRVAAAVGTLAVFVGFMAALDKVGGGGSGLASAGKGMLAVAGAMYVLSYAMERLGSIDPMSSLKAFIALAGIGAGLVATAFALKTLGVSFAEMQGASVGLLVVAAAINMLVFAFKSLSQLSIPQLITGLAGLAGVMAALVVAMSVMNNTGGKGAGGLLLFGVALNVIAVAMQNLGAVNIVPMVTSMIAAFALLAGTTLLVNAFQGAIWIAIAALAAFGGALMLIHTAIAGLKEDFGIASGSAESTGSVFSNVFGGIGNAVIGGLSGVSSAITNIFGGGLSSVTDFFVGLPGTIVSSLGGLKDTVVGLIPSWDDISAGFNSMISGIGSVVGDIGSVIGDGFGLLGDTISTLLPSWDDISSGFNSMVSGVGSFASNFFSGATEKLGPLKDTIAGFIPSWADISSGFDSMVTGVGSFASSFFSGASDLLSPLTDTIVSYMPSWDDISAGFDGMITGVGSFAGNFVDVVTSGFSGFKDMISGLLPSWDDISGTFASIGENIGSWALSIPSLIGDGLSGIGDTIFGGIKSFFGGGSSDSTNADAEAAGASFVESVGAGIESSSGTIASALSSLFSSSSVSSDIEASSQTFGEAAISGIGTAIMNATGSVQDALTGVFDSLSTDSAETAGSTAGGKYVSGVSSKKSEAASAGSGLASSASSGASEQSGSMYTNGVNLAQGLINGMASMLSAVYNQGHALGDQAVKGSKDGMGEHSPSRFTFEQGVFGGMGLINGLASMSKKVYNSGYSMGERAVDGARIGVQYISDILNGELQLDPTIRPVLDVSNVQTGVGQINTMLSGSLGNYTLFGTTAMAFNSRRQNGNKDVVDAVERLGSSIRSLPRNTYSVGGVTYDDGSNVANAVNALVNAVILEGRM